MNTNHYICTVSDSINDYKQVASTYCDVRTTKQAEKYFRKHPAIKKFIGRDRYQITFRQNSVVIQG